ncbi:MAG: GGDEF domain-containing protein [Comamonadaceae bacterium]|nr:GGDEF domain-containing protein [Comamonadaceae bacterium]
MAERTTSDIARETLKQLALRRLAPTPEHYQMVYAEIAGVPAASLGFPEGPLRAIMRVLPAQTPPQIRLLEQFGAAVHRQDWTALQSVLVGYANLGLHAAGTALPPPEPEALQVLPDDLAEQLARLLDSLRTILSEDDPRVHDMALEVTQLLRAGQPPSSTLALLLANFSYRLSFSAEELQAIRLGLLALLHLVFENISALSPNDDWLRGQAEALMAAATPPLTLRRLDDVQRRLKDVIFKQTEARARSNEAQEQMKELLATFIERLTRICSTSDQFHLTLERCADQIGQASRLEDITPVLHEVMNATRAMALDSRVAHEELQTLRTRAEEKRAEIARLQEELDQASALARHDPLTGALNRKGLDETMERELARARRLGSPLCVALLDIDNFKALNDRLGHASGDAALQHLTEVTRSVMRPQDMLARYGGEEFVLVLPDTTQAQGVQAMQRLQRELTTRFFLQNNEKLLITFSAGVAQLGADETSTDAIRRADQGMYLAKRAGKNRVVPA